MDANQSCTDSPRCVTAARNPIPKPYRNLPSFDTVDASEIRKSPVDMENLPPYLRPRNPLNEPRKNLSI